MTVRQPFVEALLHYQKQHVYPLHTPGHKGGRGMLEPLRSALGPTALQMDVSLMAELDDIHQPSGCLKEAQELAARLYGSDACFFSVNGTTEAIQALLLTALNPGDKILIPRNSHRSVQGGMVLADARPVYLEPEYLPEFGLYGQVTVDRVEKALQSDEDIKAVFLTSPNYYGLAADVKGIAACAHRHGAVLLVDEAHGPHLGFSPLLPPSALRSGADACAQSTHKLLGAMTQASMLQVKKTRLSLQRAADVMSLLTTTSPNNLLLASLDAARAQLEQQGAALAGSTLQAAGQLRRMLRELPELQLLDERVKGQAGIADLDASKVTVNFRSWGISGVEAAAYLRRAGIAVELADAENLLFLVTYADDGPEWASLIFRIKKALLELFRQRSDLKGGPKKELSWIQKPQHLQGALAATPREVFYGAKKSVPLSQAAGKICAESISFYPPGIPVIVPGEIFTEAVIAYCRQWLPCHLVIQGAADAELKTVRVLASR